MNIRYRSLATWLLFGVAAVVVCLVAPLVGSTPISLHRVFDSSIPFADNSDAQIFFVARLPRVLAGALALPLVWSRIERTLGDGLVARR